MINKTPGINLNYISPTSLPDSQRKISSCSCNTLVYTDKLTHDEWLRWRNKGIGGSDASVVCGMNKYKSPVELWMEKTGMIEPKEAGEAAYWGTMLEPLVRDEFSKVTGLNVEIKKAILQHPRYPFMLANLDGIVYDPIHGECIFEAKTSSVFRSDEWDSGIPDEYLLQVQHYMAVTSFKGAYIAVLIGGNQFKWKFIGRDEELIDMIIKLEKSFWDHVTDITPPPLDGTEASANLLNRLYPDSIPQSKITLPDEALRLIQHYEEYQEKEKLIVEEKELMANQLKDMLKGNETGVIGSRVVTWKSIQSERLNTKKLKEEMPDIHEKYVSASSYRRFTIK